MSLSSPSPFLNPPARCAHPPRPGHSDTCRWPRAIRCWRRPPRGPRGRPRNWCRCCFAAVVVREKAEARQHQLAAAAAASSGTAASREFCSLRATLCRWSAFSLPARSRRSGEKSEKGKKSLRDGAETNCTSEFRGKRKKNKKRHLGRPHPRPTCKGGVGGGGPPSLTSKSTGPQTPRSRGSPPRSPGRPRCRSRSSPA